MLRLLTGLVLLEQQHLIYPRPLIDFGMLVFFTNLSLMELEFQVRYVTLFSLFSVTGSFGWFWMRNHYKEYPVNVGVPQGSILGPTYFLLYIDYLPDDVICNIAIYDDDIFPTLNVIKHLICGNK